MTFGSGSSHFDLAILLRMDRSISAKSILVVEDDSVYRHRLARAFRDRSLAPVLASSLSEVEELVSSHPNFSELDYAVIDLRLGDECGLQVLKFLQKSAPKCKCVMLTGFGTIATTVTAMKNGAVDYLTKPSSPDVILNCLMKLPNSPSSGASSMPTLEQLEWEHIQRTLHEFDGNITLTAKALGLHRRSLQRKLSKDPGCVR